MNFDEYLNQTVSLEWTTDNFDLATRIVRKFEERNIEYECSKRHDKWVFKFTTNNEKAVQVIEMVKVG